MRDPKPKPSAKALEEALRPLAAKFGPALAQRAYARGLAVTESSGATHPIPITATPVVLEAREIRRRAELTASLSAAAVKMAQAVLAGPARELLLGALSPLERQMAERTFNSVRRLATTRIDYFLAGERAWALEINATIPAMQGYSDIAAQSFVEAAGEAVGLNRHQIEALWRQNGSNARALYDALRVGYARERGGQPRRIALLCRRHDAQISELGYLAKSFQAFGTEADLVFPDELASGTAVRAKGKTYDLVYRHLFVRRLEESPAPAVAELLERNSASGPLVLNPPASHVEVKTAFALLSQATAEPELADAASLSPAELAAAAEAVPWTRVFRRTLTTGPDGKRVPHLVSWVAERPGRFVLKRAWDYGGKAVFVGQAAGEPSFEERVRAAYGEPLSWAELCERAADDRAGGGFVVQELVRSEPEPHLLCTPEQVEDAQLYVDFSAYGSVGIDPLPAWGGVCRGSKSRIVNIVGGGGVLPLITSEVAQALLAALRARTRSSRLP